MADRCAGHVTAVCGLNDLSERSLPDVDLAVAWSVASGAAELRIFINTVGSAALQAAGSLGRGPRRVAILPSRLKDLSRGAHRAVELYADEVVTPEQYPPGLSMEQTLLLGAGRLLAFTSGRNHGWICHPIREALERKVEVDLVVASPSWDPDLPLFTRRPPPPSKEGIFTTDRYRNLRRSGDHQASDQVRRLVAGLATGEELEGLVDTLASRVERYRAFRDARAITAVPGRRPGEAGPMDPLARALAHRTGMVVLEGWIEHAADPDGGHRAFGIPSDPEAHARALRVTGPGPDRVVVLDAVWPTAGALEGAMSAVRRDTSTRPVGLALLRADARWKSKPPRHWCGTSRRMGNRKRPKRRRPRRPKGRRLLMTSKNKERP